MTPHNLGVLSDLFDRIKNRVNEGVVDYSYVKKGLEEILSGEAFLSTEDILLPTNEEGLVFVDRLHINASNITKLEPTNHRFAGFENIQNRLGSFFTDHVCPYTKEGEGAILESTGRFTILSLVQKLIPNIQIKNEKDLEKKLLEMVVTFSLVQVLEIIKQGLPNTKKRKSLIFLVHTDHGVGAVVVPPTCKIIYGKDWKEAYAYSKGTQLIVRNTPDHLKPKK